MSVGQVSGWATINFNELQSKVSTLPSGPISLKEASLVVSFFSIGGFVGNFAILPVTHLIGAKQTAHILGIPLIVRKLQINQFCLSIKICILSGQHITYNLCTECVFFICIEAIRWIRFRFIDYLHSNTNK